MIRKHLNRVRRELELDSSFFEESDYSHELLIVDLVVALD